MIALAFAHVARGETPYLVAALFAASILDLESVIAASRARASGLPLGDHSLAPIRGLLGLLAAGVLSALLFLADGVLARVVFVAFATRLVQEWVIGKSAPLAPFDGAEIRFFAWTARQRALADAAIGAVFGALWILYLAGVR